jgi:hypothetical protein
MCVSVREVVGVKLRNQRWQRSFLPRLAFARARAAWLHGNASRCPLSPRPTPAQEYNTEAAFAAAVLLSFLALFTLLVKDRLESQAAEETSK